MFTGFDAEACSVIDRACDEAAALDSPMVETGHLVVGLVDTAAPGVIDVLYGLGLTATDIRTRALDEDMRDPLVDGYLGLASKPLVRRGTSELGIRFTRTAVLVLELALREAFLFGAAAVGPEHLLLGVASVQDAGGFRALVDLTPAPALPDPGARPDTSLSLEIRNGLIRWLADQASG
jgi:hypothetical protein